MILLEKDYTIWFTNCNNEKIVQAKIEDVKNNLDILVKLDEGVTLKHLLKLINDCDLYDLVSKNFKEYSNTENDTIDETFEYISIIPKYTLDINMYGAHLISKSYNCMNIELSDGDSIFIFDYMLSKQVLDLEIRIERDIIEYNDAKYFMPEEMTLRELIFAISDGIMDSDE